MIIFSEFSEPSSSLSSLLKVEWAECELADDEEDASGPLPQTSHQAFLRTFVPVCLSACG